MKGYKVPVVVIGGGVNGLGIIRNIGTKGIDVYCAVDEKSDIAIYSKYCKETFICPGVEKDLQVLKDFLKKLKKRINGKAVLFPTSDLSVLNASKAISELDSYEAVMPKCEVLETLIVKRKFYKSLEKTGIPHPTTLYPDTENFDDLKTKLQYPVFIKPSISPLFAEKFPRRKGFIANSERELHYYLSLMQKHQIEVMVQEIVQGPFENHYTTSGYFNKNSEPIIFFAKHLLRAPSLFDSSSAGISIPASEVPEMKDATIKYLTSINYCGIFNTLFKKDSRNNIFKFLEVNARSWWNNTFPTICGVNIILTAYLEAIGEEVKPTEKYESGIYNIYLLRDLVTILAKNVDLNHRFQFRKRLRSFTGRTHYTDYAGDDPKPFLISLLNLITGV